MTNAARPDARGAPERRAGSTRSGAGGGGASWAVVCGCAERARPPSSLAWNRSVDLLIDEDPVDAATLDKRLEALTHIALDKGSALGIVSVPRPVTVERVAAWTNTLAAKGPGACARQRAGPAADERGGREMSDLPYRPNVGAVLFNRDGLVFVARRADMPNAEGPAGGWQLPQGGIDEDEDPEAAVLRELEEEIGTRKADVIGEHPDWLTYDLPPDLLGIAWRGRYRGPAAALVRHAVHRARTATSGSISIRIPNSMPGAGFRCRAAVAGGAVQAGDLRSAHENPLRDSPYRSGRRAAASRCIIRG